MTERNDEVPVDTTLWCVNIKGPDDVLAVASRAEAVELASRFNEVMTARFEPPSHPDYPLMWATPTQWPHDDASHAENLGDLGEYAWLRDPAPTERKVSSERVSEERLEDMLAGLENLPPGPWVPGYYEDGDPDGGPNGEFYPDGSILSVHDDGSCEHVDPWKEVVAKHFARCDPDTMRSILIELLALRSSVKTETPDRTSFDAGWAAAKEYFTKGGLIRNAESRDAIEAPTAEGEVDEKDNKLWRAGTAMKGTDPALIHPDDKGHRTRFSDSSFHDEVCVLCGATDGRGDNRLERPCPKAPAAASELTEDWLRDTAMNVMLATEVEEAIRILTAALKGDRS